MGREIKFRAWDDKKNVMLCSDDSKKNKTVFFIDEKGLCADQFIDTEVNTVEGDTVPDIYHPPTDHFKFMQYTGLKDTQDVEIYAGDIVELAERTINGSTFTFTVKLFNRIQVHGELKGLIGNLIRVSKDNSMMCVTM